MNLSRRLKMFVAMLSLMAVFSFISVPQVYSQGNPSGKVVETMNSAGYTYVLLEKDGSQKWVAVPQMLLSVGDQIEFSAGMDMGKYTSKTLGKTFDSIIFASSVIAHIKVKDSRASDKPEEVLAVDKAAGPDAYTIAELYEAKSTLHGKTVVVKGKVYKVSKFGGATWIRMKDGSGSRKKGNHKLVVTSQGTAEKDEVITISGTLAADKDFGGLTYEVVVEEAAVLKQ